MPQVESIYAKWNPWHGCTKLSAGCKYCYVYRQDAMYGTEEATSVCRKTASFDLPVKKKRDGSWKLPSGKVIFTCFTSDFLLSDADPWRQDCWDMIRRRQDCFFYFFTKRIDRLSECLPPGWGGGYENVIIGCTVENQEMADYRLPIFLALPIRHRAIIAAPLLTPLDISVYLDSEKIEEVSASGESGADARPCHYDWILALRQQCAERDISFQFHQTGAHFVKDGRMYRVPRREQIAQARKAGIDYKVAAHDLPLCALEHVASLRQEPEQLRCYDGRWSGYVRRVWTQTASNPSQTMIRM